MSEDALNAAAARTLLLHKLLGDLARTGAVLSFRFTQADATDAQARPFELVVDPDGEEVTITARRKPSPQVVEGRRG